MKLSAVAVALVSAATVSALPQLAPIEQQLQRRADAGSFDQGTPYSPSSGKGAPILGGTDKQVDISNPSNLGKQSTDSGVVPNYKWRFSDSKFRLFPGGWTRTQVKQDLPQSNDISAAQQHLKKGAVRELHWHRVAEWGIVYAGRVQLGVVDEHGAWEWAQLDYGDIWYFPKGTAHVIQGLEDENEYLLAFDDNDFDRVGQTFNLGDWISRTPKDILAKNFGVPATTFDNIPTTDPQIFNTTVSTRRPAGPNEVKGDASFVYRTFKHAGEPVPGNGGTFYKIDSTNFPVSKTIAATFVTLKPGGLRELHWHPNAEEWLYFHKGSAQATVFIGDTKARTFDFHAGDTAVFPDNSGHYIYNTGKEDLVWIEIYKSNRVADIPLAQWLALTPSDLVAANLKVPVEFVEKIKKEKQVLLKSS